MPVLVLKNDMGKLVKCLLTINKYVFKYGIIEEKILP